MSFFDQLPRICLWSEGTRQRILRALALGFLLAKLGKFQEATAQRSAAPSTPSFSPTAAKPPIAVPGSGDQPPTPTLPHGLRGAVEIPDPLRWWRRSALTVLLLGIPALGAWLWWRQARRQNQPPGPRADDVARLRLQRALELVDQPKPFVAEVSAAVRAYLEARFGWRAPEQTTEEFVEELRRQATLVPDDQQALGRFLEVCDMVKFAGVRPGRTELEELHTGALRLVNDLTPITPVSPTAPKAPNSPRTSIRASGGTPPSLPPSLPNPPQPPRGTA